MSVGVMSTESSIVRGWHLRRARAQEKHDGGTNYHRSCSHKDGCVHGKGQAFLESGSDRSCRRGKGGVDAVGADLVNDVGSGGVGRAALGESSGKVRHLLGDEDGAEYGGTERATNLADRVDSGSIHAGRFTISANKPQ